MNSAAKARVHGLMQRSSLALIVLAVAVVVAVALQVSRHDSAAAPPTATTGGLPLFDEQDTELGGRAVVCTVQSIAAAQHRGGLDPRLVRLRPALSSGPFASFGSFRLLDRQRIYLDTGRHRKLLLPGGWRLELAFAGLRNVQGRPRVDVGVVLSSPRRLVNRTRLRLAPSHPFLLAGPRDALGYRIFSLSCAEIQAGSLPILQQLEPVPRTG